jgi:hypothetical protein
VIEPDVDSLRATRLTTPVIIAIASNLAPDDGRLLPTTLDEFFAGLRL